MKEEVLVNSVLKNPTFDDRFYQPLEEAFGKVKSRKGRIVDDWNHLLLGIDRCLNFFESTRDFVQYVRERLINPIENLQVKAMEKALESKRRLQHLESVSKELVEGYKPTVDTDPFSGIKELNKYAVYAGDGHFTQHSAHADRVDSKHYAVGHIYMMNLRTQVLSHLDVLRPEYKKEHEVKALKRIDPIKLRMGERIGVKVIHVYDRAVVDFNAWYHWKQTKGIYIVTREKKNMALQSLGDMEFDCHDPRNVGVIKDEQVGTSKGTLIRRIIYKDYSSGKTYSFLTNVMDVPPGVIAFIYKQRWSIEKVFDVFKNSLHEKKSWGKNEEVKCQQAKFICLLHNLLLMLERTLETEEGIAISLRFIATVSGRLIASKV